jgi:predicted transcriptional regulator
MASDMYMTVKFSEEAQDAINNLASQIKMARNIIDEITNLQSINTEMKQQLNIATDLGQKRFEEVGRVKTAHAQHLLDFEKLAKENKHLREALNFNPRAAKLSLKQKPFIVVACDEPYYKYVYGIIRMSEKESGRWSNEDETCYQSAMKDGEE